MAHKHSNYRKLKKHSKKKSKHIKEKKQKKHKKIRKYSSSSKTSSDSENDTVKNVKEQRESQKQEEWNFLETILNQSSVNKNDKTSKNFVKSILDKPGQSDRELNPYWKDGGCGLPPTYQESHEVSKINKFLKPNENLFSENFKNKNQKNWQKKSNSLNENKKINIFEESKKSKKKLDESTSAILSNDDMNALAAKLLKAEILGDKSLIEKLKAQLNAAKKARDNCSKSKVNDLSKEVVVITDVESKCSKLYQDEVLPVSKRQKLNAHFEKEKFFFDDDKYSLKNLFVKEKTENEDCILATTKVKVNNLDDLDDVYLDAAASGKSLKKKEMLKDKKSKQEALAKHKTVEECIWCLDNRNNTKHLIISTGSKSYLCLPDHESLTKGHCYIVPVQHEISMRQLDEDVWEEIKTYERLLIKMFLEKEKDVVFFESARYFKHYQHCFIQCVPLDKEVGNLAPMYFQKALSESESEWSNNKKVINFKDKDLRKTIPKGLPYFAVSFGNNEGFAHIIEDERLFPRNFGEEVIGGMLDLNPKKWRKPFKENFNVQREKALDFLEMWKNFEFNYNSLSSSTESSDSE